MLDEEVTGAMGRLDQRVGHSWDDICVCVCVMKCVVVIYYSKDIMIM